MKKTHYFSTYFLGVRSVYCKSKVLPTILFALHNLPFSLSMLLLLTMVFSERQPCSPFVSRPCRPSLPRWPATCRGTRKGLPVNWEKLPDSILFATEKCRLVQQSICSDGVFLHPNTTGGQRRVRSTRGVGIHWNPLEMPSDPKESKQSDMFRTCWSVSS